jgi:GcrA cell cycle regulator
MSSTSDGLAAWTEERVGALKAQWAEGISAGQIAKELNKQLVGHKFTRNAICGKINRLGLMGFRKAASAPKGLEKAPRTPRAAAPPRAPRPPRIKSTRPPALRCIEVESNPVGFEERGERQCAYLIGDMLCCGAPTMPRKSCCAGHVAIMSGGPGRPLNERALMSLGNVRLVGVSRVAA